MAYKLIWSPVSRDDLLALVRFIARDNPGRAASFGVQLIGRTERLQEFPEIGRVLPERSDPQSREMMFLLTELFTALITEGNWWKFYEFGMPHGENRNLYKASW